LSSFGIPSIIAVFQRRKESKKIIEFLRTNLIASAKEKNDEVFTELTRIIRFGVLMPTPDREEFKVKPEQQDEILHFKESSSGSTSMFTKTALNWANENQEMAKIIELLKMEHSFHKDDKTQGLECLQRNLSTDALQSDIIKFFGDLYDTAPWKRNLKAFFLMFGEVGLLSYLPVMFDMYSDGRLGQSYWGIAHSVDFNRSNLWACENALFQESLDTDCANLIGFEGSEEGDWIHNGFEAFEGSEEGEQIHNSFAAASCTTMGLIILSIIFYLICVVVHPRPEDPWFDCVWKTKMGSNCTMSGKRILEIISYPIQHCVDSFRYYSASKPSERKNPHEKSHKTWMFFKMVEIGLEASLQVGLHLWLLRPFLPSIMTWNFKQRVIFAVHGLLNIITLDIYPACYIENALGKILFAIIFLSTGLASLKCDKPNISIPAKLMMFFSILAQVLGRVISISSLILMSSPLRNGKYAIFVVFHFFCVTILRILFDKKIFKMDDLCNNFGPTSWKLIKFLVSIASSWMVLIYLPEDRDKGASRQPRLSLLASSAFFVLVLVENLTMVCLPFLWPYLYPPPKCFPEGDRTAAIVYVIILWVAGAVLHGLYYKFCHPWADLIQPQWSLQPSLACSFKTKLIWKDEVQLVKLGAT